MSKFDKIFANREEPQVNKPVIKNVRAESRKNVKPNPAPKTKEVTENISDIVEVSASAQQTPKKLGRPATGKKNDPDYVGFTTYIRKETHRAVKIGLLQEGEGRELSELVEELLSNWVKNS
jgi:hypothetical protein